MKKKIFLLVCLLMVAGLPRLFAQNGKSNGTRTEQGWRQCAYWSPVYCGNQLVDYLEGGDIMIHYVVNYKNGSFRFENDQIKGEVKGGSGEVFEIKELDKTYFTDCWNLTWRFNLKGDQGTHYIGTLTYNYLTGEIIVGKTVCL